MKQGWMLATTLVACVGNPPPVTPGRGGPGAPGQVTGAPDSAAPGGQILAQPWTAPVDSYPDPQTGELTAAPAGGLPPARTFSFDAQSEAVLPGDSSAPGEGFGCGNAPSDRDRLGRVGVTAQFFQNACYTDGRYNARDFRVERGQVEASDGGGREAYLVHPPQTPPQQWMGSVHHLTWTFDAAVDHTIYSLEEGSVVAVAEIDAAAITPGQPTDLGINVSALAAPTLFFAAPRSESMSSLVALGPGAQGARLGVSAIGEVERYRYDVEGTPFDTRTGFNEGPSSWANVYSDTRRFFPVELAGGALGVIWQDTKTQAVRITSIGAGLSERREAVLVGATGEILAAAASDGGTRVFAFLVEAGNGAGANVARRARLVRVDLASGASAEAYADTGPEGLNMTIFDGNVASMAVTGGQVGLMIGRTMHRSSDGLNHQGGIAVVFDADTLQVRSNLGQTSGHSFENVLTVVGNEFVGIDLGDNYPRGVNLHRFSDGKRDANVVFTFKTQHGTEPQSPAGAAYPVYPQISGAQTYYQWSNDNATYTELGGVVDDGAGITVVFASESVRGRALDNSRVGSGHNDPRNIGLVRVQRDLAKFQYGGNVLKDEQVLTSGAVESGGFYTFGGYWSEQRNAGVVWLTDYRDKDRANASRVRAAALADGTLLILWEQWTADRYVATWGQRVDAFGQPRSAAVNLGSVVRLGRRDDVLVRGQDVHIFAGRAAERALDVIVIRTGTV